VSSVDILGPIKSSLESDPYDADVLIIKAVFSHWCDAADGRWAPAWRDIDIMTLPPPLLPYLLVADMTPDGDIVYRYWGRGHSSFHGTDYSGKLLSTMTPAWIRTFLQHQYARVIETRSPKLFMTEYDDIAEPVYSLRLPLSDDGETVTGFLSFAERDGVSRQLRNWVRTHQGDEPQGPL